MKYARVSFALVAILCLAVPAAHAGTTQIVLKTGSYSNLGGEFRVTTFKNADGSNRSVPPMAVGLTESGSIYQTFCVERHETYSPGTTYAWVLNTESRQQSGSGYIARPLEDETALLFTKFYFGTLDDWGYDYGTNRKDSADALQHAIWFLQSGQVGYSSLNAEARGYVDKAKTAVTGDVYLNDVDTGADVTPTWTSGIGNVRILNLYKLDARGNILSYHQDQLTMVPLPASVLMGFGLLGVTGAFAALRRRRRRRSL